MINKKVLFPCYSIGGSPFKKSGAEISMVEEGYQDVPSGVPWGSGGNVDCETPTSGSCDG